MKKRLFLPLIAASVIVLGVVTQPQGTATGPQQKGPREHRFRIGKLNNQWKVHDPQNPQNRIIRASQGDRVIWTAAGSELYFQFPDETVFDSAGATIADGKELALTVSKNAKPGRYTYSVFCIKDKKFATGDSPPTIIIQ
ncbi:MAG TPA: hypothetical protein VMM37_09480 [Bacteroidota bacterium]|nr:hypothetical protein [Bacteroidota bacterium]